MEFLCGHKAEPCQGTLYNLQVIVSIEGIQERHPLHYHVSNGTTKMDLDSIQVDGNRNLGATIAASLDGTQC